MYRQNKSSEEPPLITWLITAALLVTAAMVFLGLHYSGVNVLKLLT